MFWCIILPLIFLVAMLVTRRDKRLSSFARGTYLLTLFLEFTAVPIRAGVAAILAIFALIPLWMVFTFITIIAGVSTLIKSGNAASGALTIAPVLLSVGLGIVTTIGLIAGIGNIVLSIATVKGLRAGHYWTKKVLHARKLSKREYRRYEQVMNHLLKVCGDTIVAPTHVFAIKSYEERAWTIGTTMFITSAALKSKHIGCLVAREMYMVNSANGGLILGLRRFVLLPFYTFSFLTYRLAPGNLTFSIMQTGEGRPGGLIIRIVAVLLGIGGGGWGVLLTSPLWLRYMQEEMYNADRFVADCGLKAPMVTYLDTHEYLDIAIPFFFDPLPDSELRIDALLEYQSQLKRPPQQTVSLQPQPVN